MYSSNYYSGLTARDLAMQCDFYKCADLLDELREIMKKESEERLKRSRVQGMYVYTTSNR